MSTAKAPRWLDLVAFLLQHRFPVTRDEIFRRVGGYDGAPESARRKFERDKDELRAIGIEIETVSLPQAAGESEQTGYRLRARSAYLPYLELLDQPPDARPYPGLDRIVLSRAELEVLDLATRALAQQADSSLATAAASARRKLAFDLPLDSSSLKRILARPLPVHVRDGLAVLQEALVAHVSVAFKWLHSERETQAERVLQPWGLVFQWSRWFCVGVSDDPAPRLYAIDQMRDVRTLSGPDATFTVPDEFDVRDYVGHYPWEFGDDPLLFAIVCFEYPESRWMMNRGAGNIVRELEGGRVEVRFRVRDHDGFTRWFLSFGRQAHLMEPATIRDKLHKLRADVAALYAGVAP